MRWPLRNQILFPMIGVVLAALVSVSVVNAFLSVRRTRQGIEDDLDQVVQTLRQSSFPLTDSILAQLRGLVGAEFVLVDATGRVAAASSLNKAFSTLASRDTNVSDATPTLSDSLEIGERRFFIKSVPLQRGNRAEQRSTLHVLFPEETYQQAWQEAVFPPLVVGSGAIIVAAVLSLGVALRVTRPLSQLRLQVEQTSGGNYRPVSIARRNDEIADLSRSFNHMLDALARYEGEVRKNEQLRTLGQLGGGIAHQLRNSVTGCRMAIELHSRECQVGGEGIEVAIRQLELMEKYLQRFLALGRSKSKPHAPLSLSLVIENVAALTSPTARHIGVELQWNYPPAGIVIRGDADELEQLLVNLVLNGVEAASHTATNSRATPSVSISLAQADDGVELTVTDSGPGPASEVGDTLFEPFTSAKTDGTGLGLAVAREIAVAHDGTIAWQREESKTKFTVSFPESRRIAERT